MQVNNVRYKFDDHGNLTDSQVETFIETQEVLTLESFERRDGSIYFVPHFADTDFDADLHEELGDAWDEFNFQSE